MWFETVGLKTRPTIFFGFGLVLAGLVLCHARRHNDLEGDSNYSITIYSFSILRLDHHCCGDKK